MCIISSSLHWLPSIWLVAFLSVVLADKPAYYHSGAYDLGFVGSYPVQKYSTSSLSSPLVNILATDPSCNGAISTGNEDEGEEYILISPRGNSVPKAVPMILDGNGSLVWMGDGSEGYGQVYNMDIQRWKGESYITFWGGDDGVGGHGAGVYYMLDSSYTKVRTIAAADGLKGDLHEFHFTDEGTVLITVYQTVQHDLSSIGGFKYGGMMWDCLFQELDLETGDKIFEWRASDHYTIQDSYKPLDGAGHRGNPHDFFHMNSIEKDPQGNYLISARYTHSVTYIDGKTGDIIWILGGKRNAFTDLSTEPNTATNFAWQHDARWHENGTVLSLFDNGAYPSWVDTKWSRGLRIALDTTAMTATLLTEYVNPSFISSTSQGSMQVLENGNVLLGYGFNGAWTEFASNGTALCDIHFQAASTWNSGNVQSYRTFKKRWIGRPNTEPEIAVKDSNVYVSWLGATEVKKWLLQGADEEAEGALWADVRTFDKEGFETKFSLGVNGWPYIRIAALDRNGDVLAHTERVSVEVQKVQLSLSEEETMPLKLLIVFVFVAGFAMGAYELRKHLRRQKHAQDIHLSMGPSATKVPLEVPKGLLGRIAQLSRLRWQWRWRRSGVARQEDLEQLQEEAARLMEED